MLTSWIDKSFRHKRDRSDIERYRAANRSTTRAPFHEREFRVSRTNTESLTEQHRIRGITRAPLRAAVRLQSSSTMQTVHSTATGHESPGGTQHQLIYAPVWKSQRGDAIRLEGRGGGRASVDVTRGKSKRERERESEERYNADEAREAGVCAS